MKGRHLTDRPTGLVQVDMRQRMQQERHAAEVMTRTHDALIAAGYEWDGMDGYTAPAGATSEAARILFAEIRLGIGGLKK